MQLYKKHFYLYYIKHKINILCKYLSETCETKAFYKLRRGNGLNNTQPIIRSYANTNDFYMFHSRKNPLLNRVLLRIIRSNRKLNC